MDHYNNGILNFSREISVHLNLRFFRPWFISQIFWQGYFVMNRLIYAHGRLIPAFFEDYDICVYWKLDFPIDFLFDLVPTVRI